jgi:hypothetical protein
VDVLYRQLHAPRVGVVAEPDSESAGEYHLLEIDGSGNTVDRHFESLEKHLAHVAPARFQFLDYAFFTLNHAA